MPARNKPHRPSLRRRLGLPALALLLAVPQAASAQEQCAAIRALIRAEYRDFANRSLGIVAAPMRLFAGPAGERLPAPNYCDFNAQADTVELGCTWLGVDADTLAGTFDRIYERLNRCVEGIAPWSGPGPYGGATAWRRSTTTLDSRRRETELEFILIESEATATTPRYRYISFSLSQRTKDADEIESEREDEADGE